MIYALERENNTIFDQISSPKDGEKLLNLTSISNSKTNKDILIRYNSYLCILNCEVLLS